MLSNIVLIITVCVKVANSTFLVTMKGQSGLSYRGIIYAIVLQGNFRLLKTNRNMMHQMLHSSLY